MLYKLRNLVAIGFLLSSTICASAVDDSSVPEGTILIVEKQADASPKSAGFTLAELENLSGRTATVRTPWFEGKVEFSGPYLRDVIAAAGIDAETVRITALNDYEVEFPVEDALKFDVILATRMNGKPMSVRNKGPLFVIYPFDKNPELYTEKYFNRSVWQVKSIKVAQ
jgi:hypothetical protein